MILMHLQNILFYILPESQDHYYRQTDRIGFGY